MTHQPLCMSQEELELWEEANERLNAAASGPCLDCPVDWRERMNAVGMCNRPAGIATPMGVHEEEDEDMDQPEPVVTRRRRETWARAARQYRARKKAAA